MKISTQLRFLVFLLGTATICACTNPDGTTMTEGSGKDNGYLAMPSHIEKDSIIDPDEPGTIFKLNITDPYAFRSACLKKRGTTAYYIAMEFDGDIPAGTTFNGEIPAIKVYEDAATLAFLDINPASAGHTLVISKAEYPDLFDIPLETLVAVHATVQKVALTIRALLAPDGMNIVQNNGTASGQTIFHYHVHIIPRWEGDGVMLPWKPGPTDMQTLQSIGSQLRTALDQQAQS